MVAHCRVWLLCLLMGLGLVLSTGTAAAQVSPQILLVFPSVRQNRTELTGLAIANPTEKTATVVMVLAGADGKPVQGPGIVNPVQFEVPAQHQEARLLTQFFGGDDLEGWILLTSDNISIVGFFIELTSDARKIDGAEATIIRALPQKVLFPQILSGSGAQTEINLLALAEGDEDIPVTVELFNAAGQMVASEEVTIADGGGRFQFKVSELFQNVPAKAYVMASAETGVLGYESFSKASFVGGRNAIEVPIVSREIPFSLFGAQFAEGFGFTTEVTIVNTSDGPANVTVSVHRSTGSSTPAARKKYVIPARGMIKESGRRLVDLPPGDFVGWLRIDSDVTGVVGDITFGDPAGELLASVQLQGSPLTDVVFSHVADGLGWFTGLTFLNVHPDPADVRVEVFDTSGRKTGDGRFILEPFEHRPRRLSEIIPGFQPQLGGFARVTSDVGIFTFELFGFLEAAGLVSLAAVPPQRGNGSLSGTVQPGFTGAAPTLLQRSSRRYPVSAAKSIQLDPDQDFRPGEIIVKFRGDQSSGAMEALRQELNLRLLIEAPGRLQLLSVPPPAGSSLLQSWGEEATRLQTLALIEELNRRPGVLYAEPNYIAGIQRVPSDPGYQRQWHYPFINLPDAWDITTGSPDIVIAVIDTGAKFNHPDLGPRLTGGQFDFISDPQTALDGDGLDGDANDEGTDPNRQFSNYHGSHVAGTIGASTNDNWLAGVNWRSPLMTLRALGAGGRGTYFDIAQSILYAARLPNASGLLPARQARVINMSLGGSSDSRTMKEAIAAAVAANSIIVAAAGNANSDEPYFPASYEEVISVGSVDLSGARAPYSNFGLNVDIVAPGGNTEVDLNQDGFSDGVLSHSWDQQSEQPSASFLQGTSMAAPHVAGIVGLMLAVQPSLTPSQAKTILQNSAYDLGAQGPDSIYGHGLVDPVAALRAAGAAPGNQPKLVVSTNRLDFRNDKSSLTVNIYNAGGGILQVERTRETDSGGLWLDAGLNGGLLTVTVDRTGLGAGRYTGRLRLTSNGGSAVIEVAMEVRPPSNPDVGEVFVLALDPRTFDTVAQAVTSLNGEYKFRFPPTFAGEYVIVAGTDEDENGLICEDGEYCGLYPVASQPTLVRILPGQETAAIDFVIDKDVGLSSSVGSRNHPGFQLQGRRLPALRKLFEKLGGRLQ